MTTQSAGDPKLSPHDLARRRDDEDLFLLDVRRTEDFEDWAIAGSHNLPIYDQLLEGDFSGLAANLDRIPRDTPIAVVCVAGITSADAAAFLRERGYDARSVADGMRGWGRVHVTEETPVDGVLQVIRPGTGCISYVVHDGGEAILVDPSQYLDEYREVAEDAELTIVGVVDTHAHADHISGGHAAVRDGIPYYLPADDAHGLATYTPIADGDVVQVGDRAITVIHTPGHTPGSVTLRYDEGLLTGDTLFLQGVGRPDLEDQSEAATRAAARSLFESLDRLRCLPDDTVVLPGHVSDESTRPFATTLGDLASQNRLFDMDDEASFVDAIVESLAETPANYERIKKINWGEEPLTDDAVTLELGPNNCAAN